MSPLNSNSARVIDPVLSGIAQGYRHAQRVGQVLFPSIEVMQRGGNVIEFGRESFIDYKARRAPGASALSIQFGYEGKPYSLAQYSLDVPVPREHAEDAQAVPGIDLGKRAVNVAMDSLTLSLEIEQAELAANPANYGASNKLALAGNGQWSHPDSTPIADVEAAKDQVRRACGVEPNRMVISNGGFKALKYHPTVMEKFKYTTSDSISEKMLAALLGLDELAVGKATYVETGDTDGEFKEAWGDVAVMAYVPMQNMALEQPSFGYTYTLKGHPFVEPPDWSREKRSWIYGVTYERKPVLTGIASGFLFSSITGA